jgi:hypothetical protein
MVKSIRAYELADCSSVPTPLECLNAGERGVKRPLRAVPRLTARYGFKPGESAKEKDSDYCRVLDVNVGNNDRLIVCKDEIQVVHQRYIPNHIVRQHRAEPLGALAGAIRHDLGHQAPIIVVEN